MENSFDFFFNTEPDFTTRKPLYMPLGLYIIPAWYRIKVNKIFIVFYCVGELGYCYSNFCAYQYWLNSITYNSTKSLTHIYSSCYSNNKRPYKKSCLLGAKLRHYCYRNNSLIINLAFLFIVSYKFFTTVDCHASSRSRSAESCVCTIV